MIKNKKMKNFILIVFLFNISYTAWQQSKDYVPELYNGIV